MMHSVFLFFVCICHVVLAELPLSTLQGFIELKKIDVEVSYRKISSIDGIETLGSGRFRFNGNRYGYVADLSMSTPYKFNKQEFLHQNGEFVRLIERRQRKDVSDSKQAEGFSRGLFFEPKIKQSFPYSLAGDVVKGGHCPVVGCFDGFFLFDYFPNSSLTSVETIGDFVVMKSSTVLGSASCKLDSTRGYAVVAFEVEKEKDSITTGGRVLQNVLYDPDEPKSALERKTVLLDNVEVKSDSNGLSYVESCALMVKDRSARGLEGDFRYEWQVKSINLRPSFVRGDIRPVLKVADGERLLCDSLPQLPYQWSESANWVVPMASSMEEVAPSPNNGRFLIVGTLVSLCAVLTWLVFGRKK